MEERTKLQKIILVILAVMTLVSGGILAYHRSQPGIRFREAFLKQSFVDEITVYSGDCKGTTLHISVTPLEAGTAVDLIAENGWERSYVVSEWDDGMGKSPGRPVQVADETGAQLFRGRMWSGDYLMDENGDIDLTNSGFSVSTEYSRQESWDPWTDYEPTMLKVVQLAMEPQIVRRGDVGLFVLMLLFTAIMAVDLLWPTLLFRLKHVLDVRDPEPSDFYIATQRIGWVVSPFLLAIGYFMAVTAI